MKKLLIGILAGMTLIALTSNKRWKPISNKRSTTSGAVLWTVPRAFGGSPVDKQRSYLST